MLVTLGSLGPMERRPATTIQTAMTIQGCLPRTDQVMMRRMCRLLSSWDGLSEAHIILVRASAPAGRVAQGIGYHRPTSCLRWGESGYPGD